MSEKKVKSASEFLDAAIGDMHLPTPPSPKNVIKKDELSETKIEEEAMVATESEGDPMPQSIYTVEEFKERFLESSGDSDFKRVNVSLNSELMTTLKSVVFYLEPKCPLYSYIENILNEHLQRNKDLINGEVEKKFRPTIIE